MKSTTTANGSYFVIEPARFVRPAGEPSLLAGTALLFAMFWIGTFAVVAFAP